MLNPLELIVFIMLVFETSKEQSLQKCIDSYGRLYLVAFDSGNKILYH